MIRRTVRRSRRRRRCDGISCRRFIEIGDAYTEMVASPDHGDLGNQGWWRLRICSTCQGAS